MSAISRPPTSTLEPKGLGLAHAAEAHSKNMDMQRFGILFLPLSQQRVQPGLTKSQIYFNGFWLG
jgi:hypothetical protein